jgi:hypothetical protein
VTRRGAAARSIATSEVDEGDGVAHGMLSVLARKTAAQHRDNCRAFVTTNGCFPSKATKDPLTFVEERRPLFSVKRQR